MRDFPKISLVGGPIHSLEHTHAVCCLPPLPSASTPTSYKPLCITTSNSCLCLSNKASISRPCLLTTSITCSALLSRSRTCASRLANSASCVLRVCPWVMSQSPIVAVRFGTRARLDSRAVMVSATVGIAGGGRGGDGGGGLYSGEGETSHGAVSRTGVATAELRGRA